MFLPCFVLLACLPLTSGVHVPSKCSHFTHELYYSHIIQQPFKGQTILPSHLLNGHLLRNLSIHVRDPSADTRGSDIHFRETDADFRKVDVHSRNADLYSRRFIFEDIHVIKAAVYDAINTIIPESKEIQHTCRINITAASREEIDFLKAIKSRYSLCFVCDGISDGNCDTVGVCSKDAYCYRGHNPDHGHHNSIQDSYLRPYALIHGCCDPTHDPKCRSANIRSLKPSVPVTALHSVNYTLHTCNYNVCVSDSGTLQQALINQVYKEDGGWSNWSQWSSCSASCGRYGYKTRTRKCNNPPPAYNGRRCSGISSEQHHCHNSCPTANAAWASWTVWSSCSASCDNGIQTKVRSCTNPPPYPGGPTCLGSSNYTQTCHLRDCPVDGLWGAWSSYSACSVTCCTGSITRTRLCNKPAPAHGGKDCVGASKEASTCKNLCKGDAQWSHWEEWSKCSVSCTTGTRSRVRTCTNQSACTGPCVGNSTETMSCDDGPCPVWSSWFYGACSVTCGNGSKQGIRRCSSGHEEDCTGPSLKTETCNDRPCPVDGQWSTWHDWGKCSVSCGTGDRTRYRVCNNPPPADGGQNCAGNSTETGTCREMDCPHWGDYYEVGSCSVTCGNGVVQLQRDCSTGNSRDCTGSAYDEKPCSRPDC